MFKKNPAIRHKVLINLLSGNGIEGVITQQVGHHYVLKGATVHEVGQQPAPADGEIVVDAANVDFIQILT